MEDLYENVEDCRILINNSQLDEEVIKLCDKISMAAWRGSPERLTYPIQL